MGKNLRLWGADGGAPSIWLIVCEITYFVPLGLAELQRLLSVLPWKTENTNIYTRVCICSPMSRACVFRFCQTTPKLQLWAIHLNADSTACFFGGVCVYDSLHQNTRLSVLMTIAVFQYLETFPFSFLSVIPHVLSLLCSVCSFSSIVNFFYFYGPTKNHMRWQSIIQYFLLSRICFPFTKDYDWKKISVYLRIFF